MTEAFNITPSELQTFSQLSSELLCILTPELSFQKLNSAWQRVLGWTPTELINQPWLLWVHPNDRAMTLAAIAQAHLETVELEHRYCDRRGNYHWLSWQIALNPDGGISGAARDCTSIKQVEATLTACEQRYRSWVETSHQLLWSVDVEGRYTFVNSAARQIYGYEPEEMIGRSFSEFIAVDHPHQNQSVFEQISAREPSFEFETEHLRKDGTSINLKFNALVLRDQTGTLIGTMGTAIDTTDRKQAAERLRLLESVVVNAQDAVLITEANLIDFPGPRIVYVNQAFTRCTGYSLEDVLGKTPRILQGAKTDRAQLNKIRLAIKRQQTVKVELINYRKDGSEFWVEFEIVPLVNDQGIVTHFVSVQRNITERKQVEHERQQLEMALQQSEERFRTAVENMLDCFGVYSAVRDRTGEIVEFRTEYLNPAATQSNREVEAGLLLPAPTAINLFESYRQVVETGKPWEQESVVYQQVLGQQELAKAYDIRVNKLGDGVVVCWRDITERKQIEEDIRRALAQEKELNELKSRFISMVSHEFRTPLSTILCSTELLQSYGQQWTEEKKQVRFNRIKESIKRMSQLLNDVLTIGKVDAGRLQFNPTLINVVELCQQLVEEFQSGVQPPHTLTLTVQTSCLTAYADEKLLRHILTNLLSNAIKYSPQGGEIQFRLTGTSETLCFQIQDQGIGIPMSDQSTLFAAFQRGSNVDMIPGTGLGLSIVKQCVDLHGGKITVSSQIDRGTVFTVILPLKQGEG